MIAGSPRNNTSGGLSTPGTAQWVDEHEEIRIGLEADDAFAELARVLGRPTSREVHRNAGRRAYRAVTAEWRAVPMCYRTKLTHFEESPGHAHAHSATTRLRLLGSPSTTVIELVRAGGRDGLTVSAETIY